MSRPRSRRTSSLEAAKHVLELPCTLTPVEAFPLEEHPSPCPVKVRRVLVDELVQGGRGWWSQVYAGRIVEAEGLAPEALASGRVIVKLVHPRLFHHPQQHRTKSKEEVALACATREASAYAVLQGLPVVPAWYGSYYVRALG